MKIILIVLIILFFCVSFNSIFAEDINSINRKLKTDIFEIPPNFKLSELDRTIINKWKSGQYKNFQIHKFTFNDKNILQTDGTGIRINEKKYFVGNYIPSNTKRINQNDKVKAYTLFNVLYYLDNKGNFSSIALSSLGVVTLGMWAGEYANYQASNNSLDAQKDRDKIKLWSYLSVGTVGYLGYQVYRNWDELSSFEPNQETNNLFLGLSTAFLIGSAKMYRVNKVNYDNAKSSTDAEKYRSNTQLYSGISVIALINWSYQIYRNRDYLIELF